MTVLDSVSLDSLSVAMREGSMAQHKDAENSGFMSELLGGRVNEQGYLDYLFALRTVYEALEETGRSLSEDPAVAKVHDTALERLATIDADFAHWCAGRTPRVSAAATAYAERIRGTSAWAPAYVAHHYTRYLGDLSGGQAIGRILDRTFGMEGQGLSFYSFETIEKPKVYKDGYRAALDAIELDDAGRARLIEEVQVAFRHNQALFEELGANLDAYRR